MIVYGIITAVAVILFMRWPTTFIPEEDDGYFLVVSQLPPAASLNRTEAVTKQFDEMCIRDSIINYHLQLIIPLTKL